MAEYPIITDVTYDELVALRDGNLLEPGLYYCITDYVTTFWLMHLDNGMKYVLDEGEKIIKTGSLEPLTVLALDVNKLSSFATSEQFPDDLIHYQLELGGISDTIDTPWCEGTDSSNDFVPGFKGIITYRKDTIKNLSAQLDWRNWEYRKYSIEQAQWTAKAYASGDYVQDDEVGTLTIYKANQEVIDMAQVETVTLTGTNGWATISGVGGLSREVTFATGGTLNLEQTAADFVTSFADDYAESDVGIIVTSVGANLIFTSDIAGVPIIVPVITPSGESDDDLDGMVVHTTANHSVNTFPYLDPLYWDAVMLTLSGDAAFVSYGSSFATGRFGSIPIIDLTDFLDTPIFGTACYNIELQDDLGFSLLDGVRLSFITFGSNCTAMTFGSNCNTMTFGSSCYTMTFGSGCGEMTFGSECYSMTFGSGCYTMTFDSGCYTMTFGSGCYSMTFDSSCYNMTFGSGCYIITFGSVCAYMTFGSGCNTMTFGSGCYTMTFGSNCYTITFGSGCAYMTFGSGCNTMTFGSGCELMTFGSGCIELDLPAHSRFNNFLDGVSNKDFTTNTDYITTGITVTHQIADNGGIKIVQSYLNYNTDHWEMVYDEDKLGVPSIL